MDFLIKKLIKNLREFSEKVQQPDFFTLKTMLGFGQDYDRIEFSFFGQYDKDILDIIAQSIGLIMIIIFLICVAYFTLIERKVIGYLQKRKGPNKVGFFGLLQPISDAIKLFSKQ